MKTEFIKQYGHTWRVFAGLVRDFDQDAWFHTGRGVITPARLAFHILKSIKYYIEDSSTILFSSGRSVENNWETAQEEDLPSQADILACITELSAKTEEWLCAMDLNAENRPFPWAGKTKLGVVLFLLRHTLYHMGELSSLLNESRNGEVEDNYVKAL
jgi:uncharacterized damage-inducible protein DinB